MPWNAVTNIRGPQGVQGNPGADGNRAAVTRSVNYATSVTVAADPSVAVDRVNIVATGALALNISGGADGQIVRVNVGASGAQRVVTVNSGIRASTGQSRTITIPSGQIAFIAFEFSSMINLFTLTAVTISES